MKFTDAISITPIMCPRRFDWNARADWWKQQVESHEARLAHFQELHGMNLVVVEIANTLEICRAGYADAKRYAREQERVK